MSCGRHPGPGTSQVQWHPWAAPISVKCDVLGTASRPRDISAAMASLGCTDFCEVPCVCSCQTRSKFTYDDELATQKRNQERRSVRLIDEIENAKDSTGLQGNSLKRPQRADSRGLAVKSPLHENENYSDPFDDMAVLDTEMRDDDGERTMTFRSVLIGVLTSILGAAIAEVFMFKPVHIHVDILFLQIICLLMGHFFATIPGPLWWNPGPLDTKETVFSVIMAASASAGVLGVEVIAAQDVMFEKRMSMIVSIMTLLSSQLIGYGIAGLLRPILVYPAEIIYPGVLPVVALFQSMSSQSQTTVKQMTFFKKAISAISLYEIIPTYLAPALSAVSIWCLTLPKVPAITNLFGGSLPAEGMGLMAFSGDWTLVGSHSPLFVPLLAQMTDWLAYFGCIVIYSGAYTANWFSGGHLPFISYNIFDKNGHRYNLTAAVMKNGTGNASVIEQLGPPSFSTSFVLSKSFLCMAASASVTIGMYTSLVSYLKDRKQIKMYGKISKPCPHREITKKMRDFPAYAYAVILVGATALAFLSSHLADSGLSPEALATSLLISFVLCLASGYFYGTLGIHLFVAREFVEFSPAVRAIEAKLNATFWLDYFDKPSCHSNARWPNISWQCNRYNVVHHVWLNQRKTMCAHAQRLEVGNLHASCSVVAQLIGTITGGLVHVLVMFSIINAQREVLLMPNGNGIFTGMYLSVIASQSTGWGLFSQAIYYPGKIYVMPHFSFSQVIFCHEEKLTQSPA
ncbi:uncharacterized protein PGTG_17794 [Puccinia graminis f. sp. tritici CRL 75-36-700-3]|uniref:Oligopeptide transporter n=1 Tax=Puccinia graminis f. sp. tritici (strain CRL 75-36-700-3 / race SCCL) TaxID=418459 RepID=E3L5G9_PUCGT|nr:uncharacterized protein PGTG_17794 [Puccinia graminis f. sp. tritici CRL 75-36-700-3]EFP91794.2 hypothetical protein PGTG_17794 [Puccinia graminis f. sp. tritici CRL 75-36-700-3]